MERASQYVHPHPTHSVEELAGREARQSRWAYRVVARSRGPRAELFDRSGKYRGTLSVEQAEAIVGELNRLLALVEGHE